MKLEMCISIGSCSDALSLVRISLEEEETDASLGSKKNQNASRRDFQIEISSTSNIIQIAFWQIERGKTRETSKRLLKD